MNEAVVVTYHYVRDVERTPFPRIKALSVAEFEAQLDWLQVRYRVADYASFQAAVERRAPGGCALLTFDDGFVDHYANVFPALRRRGLSALFFAAGPTFCARPFLLNVHKIHFLLAKLGAESFSRNVRRTLAAVPARKDRTARDGIYRYDIREDVDIKRLLNYELPYELVDLALEELFQRHIGDSAAFARELYLSCDMVREMAAGGMAFGFHTENHRVLSRLALEQQHREMAAGVPAIRELTGQPDVPFCYPYGHPHTYNRDSLDILQKLGYPSAFTVVRGPVRFGACSPYELPRFDTRDLPPFTRGIPDA